MTQTWLDSLPPVLFVALKRFNASASLPITFSKLSTPVTINTELDMSRYVAGFSAATHGSSHYDLFAVVCHSGSYEGGHYTAFARWSDASSIDGQWRFFDDSTVTDAREADVLSPATASMAYLRFYARRLTGGSRLVGRPRSSSTRARPSVSAHSGAVMPPVHSSESGAASFAVGALESSGASSSSELVRKGILQRRKSFTAEERKKIY